MEKVPTNTPIDSIIEAIYTMNYHVIVMLLLALFVRQADGFVVPAGTKFVHAHRQQLSMVRIPFLGRGKKEETKAITNDETAPVDSEMEQPDAVVSAATQQPFMDPVSLPPEDEVKEENDTANMMQKIKDSGVAGVVSYALWELAFWAISVPVCIVGYQQVTGHWPDLNDKEDIAKLSAEAFAFVNFARFAVPLRIGMFRLLLFDTLLLT